MAHSRKCPCRYIVLWDKKNLTHKTHRKRREGRAMREELQHMATRSVVAYRNDDGQTRGTYVHWDGYPSHMKPALKEKLENIGYEGVVEWIENGISAGGYNEVTEAYPYGSVDEEQNCKIDQEEYGYFVFSNGEVTVAHG